MLQVLAMSDLFERAHHHRVEELARGFELQVMPPPAPSATSATVPTDNAGQGSRSPPPRPGTTLCGCRTTIASLAWRGSDAANPSRERPRPAAP
ncbi:MAG: hypothetical protein NZU63_12335 [Gemmataceae bacterium]|nr:hypothetical protein [Gemmataceae bacterium]MDW8241582.1 hypothetical protein [Thermogemmata sp.]